MKKTVKSIIAGMILALTIGAPALTICANAAEAVPADDAPQPIQTVFDRPSIYPEALAVMSNEPGPEDIWTVTAETFSGIEYTWYMFDACDVFPGTLLAVLMDDNGTPDSVYDDTVIYAEYAGYGDPAEW